MVSCCENTGPLEGRYFLEDNVKRLTHFIFSLIVAILVFAPVQGQADPVTADLAGLVNEYGTSAEMQTNARQMHSACDALEEAFRIANRMSFAYPRQGPIDQIESGIKDIARIADRMVQRAVRRQGAEMRGFRVDTMPAPEVGLLGVEVHADPVLITEMESAREISRALTRGLQFLEAIASGRDMNKNHTIARWAISAYARATRLMGNKNELRAGNLRVSGTASQGLLPMLAKSPFLRENVQHHTLRQIVMHGRVSEITFLLQGLESAIQVSEAGPTWDREFEMPVRKGRLGASMTWRTSIGRGAIEELLILATARIYELEDRIQTLEQVRSGLSSRKEKRQMMREIKAERARQRALDKTLARTIETATSLGRLQFSINKFLRLSMETRASMEKKVIPISVEEHVRNMKAHFSANESRYPGTVGKLLQETGRRLFRGVR
jgi:hypothetical protein